MKLPAHKCGLYIQHNVHRDDYEKLANSADVIKIEGIAYPTWKDDEAKARAVATDECWTMQWYPNTPIGFFYVAAPTLDELLELAAHVEEHGN